jgi:hypothetical protein
MVQIRRPTQLGDKATEEEIQNEIMEALYENGFWFFRIHTQGVARMINGRLVLTPNGGRIVDKVTGDRMGSMTGFSDLLILDEDGTAIFLEVKSAKGSQSAKQKEFERRCIEMGFCYIIARSAQEAMTKLYDVLNSKNKTNTSKETI